MVLQYPAEVRERAVRMVLDHQGEYPSQWNAIESIAGQLGLDHKQDAAGLICPLLDALWNAVGVPACEYYAEDGTWDAT